MSIHTETIRAAAEEYVRQNPCPPQYILLMGKNYADLMRKRYLGTLERPMMNRVRFILGVVERHLLVTTTDAKGSPVSRFDWDDGEGDALMPKDIAAF